MSQTIEQKVVELIDSAQKLAEPALDVTIQALRYGAIINVVCAVVFLVTVYHFAKWAIPRWKEKYEDNLALCVSAFFLSMGIVVCVLACLFTLFSASTWLAIFAPKLQLARQILGFC